MKKIFSCILAIIILGAMLSGCSNNDSKEMIKKAKNFSIPHEVSINPTKEDYGILAYNFLHYIQDNYPGRIAGTEKEKEMAVFILSALLNGGYSEKVCAAKPSLSYIPLVLCQGWRGGTAGPRR